MNILVTGGAGYIGAELIYRLSKCDDVEKIVVYDNLNRNNFNLFISGSNRMPNNKVQFVFGDLLDSRKLRKELKNIHIVYHLAAVVNTPFSTIDSHIFEQVNNWGTAELVYAVEESKSVSKFIYLSSASVYGSSKKLVDEETLPNPKTFYGISKMRGEDHVRRLFNKMETAILRCSNVYGYSPGMRFDSVINKFMFEANFNNRISIHGTCKQARSFVSISKSSDILVALKHITLPSDVYNLSDKNIEILDIVDVMKEIYTELEFIFINQHLELRDLKLQPATKLSKYVEIPDTDFKQELLFFKEKFSFRSVEGIPAGN